MSNRLKQEKSPYLRQHGENPVDWYPWCQEAFERARREDKPVFLSIGYSTCHWCHVMAHESFENQEIARLLNQDYISVKVDREERPDIDAVYMDVCQAVTGSGGWPLTILMTPEQKPFFAGTYFPRTTRYEQPGLEDILERAADLWKSDRAELLDIGEQILTAITRQASDGLKGAEPDKALLDQAYRTFCRQFDPLWGGFGAAPKFPSPHNLLFLMRYGWEQENQIPGKSGAQALYMAEHTLAAMAQGGIQDQIGGGFSRYSTDEKWLIPHFEKMLYDNALLILAYLEAYQITGKAVYGDTVRRTADYVLRELTDPQGGFYCGQDADSDGIEGKYYAFTPKEIETVLGEAEGRKFCDLYGITEQGNFEGKSIPNRIGQAEGLWKRTDDWAKSPFADSPEGHQAARKSKHQEKDFCQNSSHKRQTEDLWLAKLYDYRKERTVLHRDDKILLSWNGWMILALARAGWILEEKRYTDAAQRAQRFLEKHMTDEKDRLYLRFCDGEAAHMGQLEDYGVYALALLELYRVTFQTEYLTKAIHRGAQMMELFEDREQGGYFITSRDAEALISRPKEIYDGAMPSGNSVAAMVLEALAALTGESKWQEAAWRQLRFLAAEIRDYPSGSSFALLAMAEGLYPHRELVCAGQAGAREELRQYLRQRPAHGLHVLVKTAANAEELAECAPFTEAYPIPDQGSCYYLCENGACQNPVTELRQLSL